MDATAIARLSRQTDFTEQQIKDYIARVTVDGITDADLAECIREAALFNLDIDMLGR